MATIFLAFYVCGAHWHHLANMTEPSMCGGDAASNYVDHLFIFVIAVAGSMKTVHVTPLRRILAFPS